jgi:hypothetical protein
MQTVVTRSSPTAPLSAAATPAVESASAYHGYQIIRRNGAVVSFEPNKIAVALMKAFLAVHGTQGAASSSPTTSSVRVQMARERKRMTHRRARRADMSPSMRWAATAHRPGGRPRARQRAQT